MKLITHLIQLFIFLFLLSACDKDDPVFIISGKTIVVTPYESSIVQGSSLQFKAIQIDEVGNKLNVTDLVNWSTSDNAIATISMSGIVNGVALGDAIISASLDDVSGSADLNVNNKTISSISVTPASEILIAGLTRQYSATALFTDNTTQDISLDASWVSQTTVVATIDTSTAIVTAVNTGTSQIDATFNSITGSAQLAVSSATVSTFITQPANTELFIGEQQQYKAIVILSDGNTIDITDSVIWASSNSEVAIVSNANESKGLATGVNIGGTTILAAFTLDGTNFSFATPADINVKISVLNSISIVQGDISAAKGSYGYLQAVAYYNDGSSADISHEASWLSSDTSIAFVQPEGRNAGFAYAVNVGDVTITVKFSDKEDAVNVEITNATIQSLEVQPVSETIAVGLNANFTATVLLSDNSKQDVTKIADWSTGDSSIAVADPDSPGQVKAVSAPASTTVTASFNGVSSTANLTTTVATIIDIVITPPDSALYLGAGVIYHADAIMSDGRHENITRDAIWTSADTGVISFDGQNIATSQGVGLTTVSAAYNGSTGATGVAVTDPVFSHLEIHPEDEITALGLSVQYKATAVYSDDSAGDVSEFVSWQSTNTQAVVINVDGVAHTINQGESTIIATYTNAATAQTTLTVTDPILISLIVVPQDLIFPTGKIQQYSALAEYTNGLQDVTNQATWQSTTPSTAVVGNISILSGVVATLNAGTTNITANFDGQAAQAALTVFSTGLTSITVMCDDIEIHTGTTTQCRAVGDYSATGRHVDLTEDVTWTSDNNNIATVSNDDGSQGLVYGNGTGIANISAAFEGITSNNVAIDVAGRLLTSITVSSDNDTVAENDIEDFSAIAHYSDGSNQNIRFNSVWSSSDETVMSMNNNIPGIGYAQAPGVVNIIASKDGVDGQKAITVVEESAGVISLSVHCTGGPASRPVEMNVGDTTKCSAQADFDDGTSIKVTADAIWVSDYPSIVQINGLVSGNSFREIEAMAIGESIIRATYSGFEAEQLVIVD